MILKNFLALEDAKTVKNSSVSIDWSAIGLNTNHNPIYNAMNEYMYC